MTIAGTVVTFMIVSGFVIVITIVFAAAKEGTISLTGMARLRHNIIFAIIAAGFVVAVAGGVSVVYEGLAG